MKKLLNDFIEKNIFYRGFIEKNIFDIKSFNSFVIEVQELSNIFIRGENINSDFVSFLLDIHSQLLMSIYEDKHKYIGITKDEGLQRIYDFIFFMIDFVNGKRKFEDYLDNIEYRE